MDFKLLILCMLGAFCAFLGYFLIKCFVRAREMRDQDDYYRGYNEMYARCITHGIHSREVTQWLDHSESYDDGNPFDRGVIEAYAAYCKLNHSALPKCEPRN